MLWRQREGVAPGYPLGVTHLSEPSCICFILDTHTHTIHTHTHTRVVRSASQVRDLRDSLSRTRHRRVGTKAKMDKAGDTLAFLQTEDDVVPMTLDGKRRLLEQRKELERVKGLVNETLAYRESLTHMRDRLKVSDAKGSNVRTVCVEVDRRWIDRRGCDWRWPVSRV